MEFIAVDLENNLRPIGLLVLVFAAIGASHLGQKWHFFIPESGVTIFVGALFGFLEYISSAAIMPSSNEFASVFLNQVLLPLIIFESGFSLKKTGIKRNFGSIMGFAVFATIISALTFALFVYYFGRWFAPQYALSVGESLIFGALISATDAVATLSILCEAFNIKPKVTPPPLYDLIFGESVLNDAVAIILFTTFKNFTRRVSFGTVSSLELIGVFIYIVVGSVLIGAVFALISALLFKYTKLRDRANFDVCLLYIFALGSYYTASMFEMSGIFAIFSCGIVMGHYTWHNLAIYTQVTASQIFKSLASVAETIIFAFVGRSVFAILPNAVWDYRILLGGLLACLLCRVCSTFPTAWLLNIGRKEKINGPMQLAIWFAGLRGGIAFSLSLQTTQLAGVSQPYVIITSTLFIAIFTTVVFGALTEKFFGLLGLLPDHNSFAPDTPGRPHMSKVRTRETFVIMKVPKKKPRQHHHHNQRGPGSINSALTPRSAKTASFGKKLVAWIRLFDQRVFKPLFRAETDVHHEEGEDGAYTHYMADFAKNMRQTPRYLADQTMKGFCTPRAVVADEEEGQERDKKDQQPGEASESSGSEESGSESGSDVENPSTNETRIPLSGIVEQEDLPFSRKDSEEKTGKGHVMWGPTEYNTFNSQ